MKLFVEQSQFDGKRVIKSMKGGTYTALLFEDGLAVYKANPMVSNVYNSPVIELVKSINQIPSEVLESFGINISLVSTSFESKSPTEKQMLFD